MPRVRRPRHPLFSRSLQRRARLPTSLLIIAGLILLLSLIRPGGFFTTINPANVTVPAFTPTPSALPRPTDVHGGHIVFTCTRKQINQICLINADGTGYRQLTQGDRNSYYPAIAPTSDELVFAQNQYDGFDLGLLMISQPVRPGTALPSVVPLTDNIGNAFAPQYSHDGKQILFINRSDDMPSALWLMDRHGGAPRLLYQPARDIVAAAWTPDGRAIAVAMAQSMASTYGLFLLDYTNLGTAPRRISPTLTGIGGSLSWAPNQTDLLFFAGPVAAREIYRLNIGTGAYTQLTFGGNNAAGAYSPDGQFIVFNSLRNGGQADLFIMRADGHSTRQLTSDPEPDWQPQWGP